MITNFEELTQELNESELKVIPALIAGFNTHSKRNPIKAPEIVKAMNQYILKNDLKMSFTQARLRKCVNYIRSQGLLPLIATSKGYYVSKDHEEILNQIKSLRERANSIHASADGLERLIKKEKKIESVTGDGEPQPRGIYNYG